MLDLEDVQGMIEEIESYVSHSIWIGKLNRIGIPMDRMYVSLERRMHCGMGKCCRCNVGSTYTCTDGPVFDAKELTWPT